MTIITLKQNLVREFLELITIYHFTQTPNFLMSYRTAQAIIKAEEEGCFIPIDREHGSVTNPDTGDLEHALLTIFGIDVNFENDMPDYIVAITDWDTIRYWFPIIGKNPQAKDYMDNVKQESKGERIFGVAGIVYMNLQDGNNV